MPAPTPAISLSFSASGASIVATIGPCSVRLSKQVAIKICRDLLDLINV
ncbi:MAG TPA: hypothetical protein VKM55_10145 [Candidatus Lokiarchaeia archaeon]|nr:hypothetical protein [Candidatus Lokiarchaeia archaeon]